MEGKSINRYCSLCRSIDNLNLSKSANPEDLFVLSGTAQIFNLTFDLSWKVMKDIIVNEYGIVDFATGSPRDTLRTAYRVGLIKSDEWLQMLKIRNTLIHDYDGEVAQRYFYDINSKYLSLFKEFKEAVYFRKLKLSCFVVDKSVCAKLTLGYNSAEIVVEGNKLFEEFKGALTENFILNMLLFKYSFILIIFIK